MISKKRKILKIVTEKYKQEKINKAPQSMRGVFLQEKLVCSRTLNSVYGTLGGRTKNSIKRNKASHKEQSGDKTNTGKQDKKIALPFCHTGLPQL